MQTASTNTSGLEQRTDTFLTWRAAVFPESTPGPEVPRTFDDEKATFQSLLPLMYSRYPGEYVAVARGTIVDHDRSRLKLVRRFFSRFTPDTPVYIGLIGARDVVHIPTPFFRRLAT
jgi:hypothetical protein